PMQLIGTLSLSVLLLVCLGSRDLVLEVHADQATAATPDNDSVEGKGDSIAGKKESSKIDLSKIDPSKDGVNNMTRMLLYEYMLETETTLVDERWPEKVRVTSKINASYAFEIIHYDKHGDILARYRLLKCNSGPCDYRMPDVYVDFIQGGNNIIGVFASLRDGEKATWNPLFSIVNAMNTPAISGDGDEQDVITPYGVCHYRFWRPEDKKFKRRISSCSLEGLRNHSLIQDATLHQYEQNVQYM
uniref:MTP large subunit lipid-binding domain-containing protein n=1 Tax=Parascaris univalens TaxID=6257 RepID=A0A915A4P4_PARUN